jgi:hypothetical protein
VNTYVNEIDVLKMNVKMSKHLSLTVSLWGVVCRWVREKIKYESILNSGCNTTNVE